MPSNLRDPCSIRNIWHLFRNLIKLVVIDRVSVAKPSYFQGHFQTRTCLEASLILGGPASYHPISELDLIETVLEVVLRPYTSQIQVHQMSNDLIILENVGH